MMRPRVAFYAHYRFLEPILRPVQEALADRAVCLLSNDRRAVRRFQPHVIVMAHHAHLEYFRFHLPGAVTVNVRHGMISKKNLRRLPARPSARAFDFVCIDDGQSIDNHRRAGVAPRAYWPTGYPQLDPLFRRDAPPRLPLDATRPTVLYAPTWDLGLTSATMFGPRLVELIRRGAGAVNIVIKPHPMIGEWRPRWMAWWRQLAEREPGVHLVADTHADVVLYMLAADVLVSDASSAVFEFLALDRPIVLVTNPLHVVDPAYDPDSIAWRWRDLGEEVHHVDDVGPAVERALRDPAHHRDTRLSYARRLFGPRTDGRNHLRVADHVHEVASAAAAGVLAGNQVAGAWPGHLAWRWHALRYTIAERPWVRRLMLGLLEAARFRRRARALARDSARVLIPRPEGSAHR